MSYEIKLREQALKYRERHTQKETSENFEVSVSAIKNWQKLQREKGRLESKPLERKWRKIAPEKLKSDVEAHAEDFAWERAKRFDCTEEAIRVSMKQNKLTRETKVVSKSEEMVDISIKLWHHLTIEKIFKSLQRVALSIFT